MAETHKAINAGFRLSISDIRNGIFLPKYYDPDIINQLDSLRATHNLVVLGDLIAARQIQISTGDEIGKMAYGTGTIPFVRTSDISNGEIKTDPKHGISKDIYDKYGPKQDVRAGDILFVRDGTYLIGQVALVTESDLPLLYQSHLLKFRVSNKSPISSWLLLACLNSSIVKLQIRAKQFTADIIDTIGNRCYELVLPIPKDETLKAQIEQEVQELYAERSRLRDIIRKIPFWTQGVIATIQDPLTDTTIEEVNEQGNPGFMFSLSELQGIFIPKYHDPKIQEDIAALHDTHELRSLGDLCKGEKEAVLSWETGIEVGKMAYGTGDIPFIRTSDISNWELKGDPKQNVSEEVYEKNVQDVRAGDIFVVRDGTYLVGTSCILTDKDTRILFCGGLYKLRVRKPDQLDPHLLLAILNTPIVRRQMRAKQFTRDIIDTLGKRLFEVILPIPRNADLNKNITITTREVIETRASLRDRIRTIETELESAPAGNIKNDPFS